MFDHLTNRLSTAFKKFGVGTKLTEAQVEEGLKEIRRSLLEADVHFMVAKELCNRVRDKAIGAKIWESLSASNQVVQIFQDELIEILGGTSVQLPEFRAAPPAAVLIMGLQGSGKTTFSAKLALFIKTKLKKTVGIVPADCARPAAKKQLQVLGASIGVPVFDSPLELGSVGVLEAAQVWAKRELFDIMIVDTAGRQQVEESLMQELQALADVAQPIERFLVLDAMLGSQGLEVAKAFHEKVPATALVLSKVDGDARGGVALSAKFVTQVPLVFASTGEKPQDLEPFYPERMASRIIGMGDVLTLIDKAKEHISEEDALKATTKMMDGGFTLDDFLHQMKMIQNMGPLEGLLKLIPGMGQALDQVKNVNPEKEFKRIEAMIQSMTPAERHDVGILNGSRRARIARGAGVQVSDINKFIKQFLDMQRMMKQFKKMGMGKLFGGGLGGKSGGPNTNPADLLGLGGGGGLGKNPFGGFPPMGGGRRGGFKAPRR